MQPYGHGPGNNDIHFIVMPCTWLFMLYFFVGMNKEMKISLPTPHVSFLSLKFDFAVDKKFGLQKPKFF
jgi:hypothetical protein